MTDRELLELAAKAAGLSTRPDWYDDLLGVALVIDRHSPAERWNPLDDDGDALRLMARLRLQVDYRCGFVGACKSGPYLGQCPHDDDDEYGSAATRRAIVRAAAALTQSKEPS